MRKQTEPTIANSRSPEVIAAPAPKRTIISERPDVEADVALDELLVEDVSIDGMCGVY
jgi:mycofactocin precursor